MYKALIFHAPHEATRYQSLYRSRIEAVVLQNTGKKALMWREVPDIKKNLKTGKFESFMGKRYFKVGREV